MRFWSVVLLLALLVAQVDAATTHSFTLKLNKSARLYKAGVAPYGTNVRNSATATSTVQSSTDSITVGAAFVDSATDTLKLWRGMIVTDTLNSVPSVTSEYLDDFYVTPGNTVRLDSVVFGATVRNGVYAGGCTGEIQAWMSDSCSTVGVGTIVPGVMIANANYNDYLTPGSFATFTKFDAVVVDTNTMGMGDTKAVTWAVTDRTLLDEIECLFFASYANPVGLQVHFISCFDADSVAPSATALPYDIKLSWNAHDNATTPMTCTVYWTQLTPADLGTLTSGRGAWGRRMPWGGQ